MSAADPVAAARREIEHLVYYYAELQDAADWDAIAELFEHGDFVADSGVGWRGKEIAERRTANVRAYFDGTPRTRHVTTNLMIAVDLERERGERGVLLHDPARPARIAAPADRGRSLHRPLRVRRRRLALQLPAQRPRPAQPLRRLPPRLRAAGGRLVGVRRGRAARGSGGQTPHRGGSSAGEPPHPNPLPQERGPDRRTNPVEPGSGPLSSRERAEGEGERAERAGPARQGVPGATPHRGGSSAGERPHPNPLPQERGPDRRTSPIEPGSGPLSPGGRRARVRGTARSAAEQPR